jgi:hypothetical protein
MEEKEEKKKENDYAITNKRVITYDRVWFKNVMSRCAVHADEVLLGLDRNDNDDDDDASVE